VKIQSISMNDGRILLAAAAVLTLATTFSAQAAPRPPMKLLGVTAGAAVGMQLIADAGAEGGGAKATVTVNPAGPNASGADKASGAPAKPDAGDPKVAARMDACKISWKAADTNGDGVLDAKEIAYYNSTVRLPTQPTIPDGSRLTEASFIAACATVTAHE